MITWPRLFTGVAVLQAIYDAMLGEAQSPYCNGMPDRARRRVRVRSRVPGKAREALSGSDEQMFGAE